MGAGQSAAPHHVTISDTPSTLYSSVTSLTLHDCSLPIPFLRSLPWGPSRPPQRRTLHYRSLEES